MSGQIHNTIKKIIDLKSKGNPIIASSVRTKMILKGIVVDKYTPSSPDDPKVMQMLHTIAKEFGIEI